MSAMTIEWMPLERLPQTAASILEFVEENKITTIAKIRLPDSLVTLEAVPLEGP